MKPIRTLGLALLAGSTFVQPAIAGTPNTLVGGAVSLDVGSGWVTQAIDESAQERWFTFREVGARSYCIEASMGVASYFALNPSVTLYADTTLASQLGTNDDGASEPPMNKGSRYCYVSPIAVTTGVPTTTIRALKVGIPVGAGSGDSGFVRVRVVDSTIVANRASSSWTYSISNSGISSITGNFYVPGTGKSSNVTVSAQARQSGTMSTLISFGGSQLVYFMHNGPAGSVLGRMVDFDGGGSTVKDESPFVLRRD